MKSSRLFAILFSSLFSIALIIAYAGCHSESPSFSEMVGFANYELLWPVSVLISELSTSTLTIIDARDPESYAAGHIPGAIHIKWGAFSEASMPMNLLPADEIAALLGDFGITGGETVVIYTEVEGSWGADGRIFWTLEYMGHPDVHILDGGWDAWAAAGGDIETTVNIPTPSAYTGTPDDTVYATTDYVSDHYDDPRVVIIDSRTPEEYDGAQLYGEPRGGHIPGAVNLDYDAFFGEDWRLIDPEALMELYSAIGVTYEKDVIFHCTAGIRSAYGYFTLRLFGHPRARNYDGSWWAWASDPSLPIESE